MDRFVVVIRTKGLLSVTLATRVATKHSTTTTTPTTYTDRTGLLAATVTLATRRGTKPTTTHGQDAATAAATTTTIEMNE